MEDKIKILIVDDEKDLTAIVKSNLEFKGGFEVVTSNDPRAAEQLVLQEKPDVILLDVVMPGRKGNEVVSALKKMPEAKNIPIIMVSGRGEMVFNKKKDAFIWMPNTQVVKDRGDLPSAKSAEALTEAYGVDDYVSKPFSTDVLIEVIRDVLQRRKRTQKTEDDDALPG
jgi:DNA-binding response OmpR family regulator